MSEIEDLQKSVNESKARQQVEALSVYLDKLCDAIDLARNRHRSSSIIYGITWFIWVISGFFSGIWNQLFETLFIFALVYDALRFSQRMKAHGEFTGCIETLRILGMIPPTDQSGHSNKRHFWSEGIAMVKGWATKKKKVQEEIYQPA